MNKPSPSDRDAIIISELQEENKNLRLENADLMGERDGLKMVVDRLKEENQTLELWLDNKEKLNEEYRKQIDIRKMSRDEKDEDCYGLAKENAELKEKLERIEKAYIEFENSERDYNKALGELDQVIMNR